MYQKNSNKSENKRQASQVYFHIVKDPQADKEVGCNQIELIDNTDTAIKTRSIGRPRKPTLNTSTSELMGKKKKNRTKIVRSMSSSNIQQLDKDIKSQGKPSWKEEETQIEHQDRCETKIHQLLDEVECLRDQLENKRQQDDVRRSNEALRIHGDKIEEIKEEINDVQIENRILRDSLSHCQVSSNVEPSNELIEALIETELAIDRCDHLMQHVFDFLQTVMKEGHKLTMCDVNNINEYFHDQDERLCEFKDTSRHLRTLLKHFQQHDIHLRETRLRDNSMTRERHSMLEKVNKELQVVLEDKNIVIETLRKELSVMNDDSINFASTQESLESIKAHLQQQLKQKSGDCNRMAVQVRILEGELIRERSAKERILSNHKNPTNDKFDDRGNLKKAARALKLKVLRAEHTIQELTSLLSVKEQQFDELMSERATKSSVRELSEKCLKDQFTQYETNTKENISRPEQIPADQNYSMLDQGPPTDQNNIILTLKKENENLHNNINQNEMKLKDIQKEIESLRKILNDSDQEGRGPSENQTLLVQRLETSENNNKLKQIQIECLERKINSFENPNFALNSSTVEDHCIISDQGPLFEEMMRENSALKRQLDMALLESQKKIENGPAKNIAKDHSLTGKIPDLEGQLERQRTEVTKWRRSCEENERKFNDTLLEMKSQLERAQTKTVSLSTYIQYLKKSYANVFGDLSA